jgi:hypothetical protein
MPSIDSNARKLPPTIQRWPNLGDDMQGIGRAFFVSALFYGVLGMLLGLHMAMSNDHGQMPTHAHIMVVGWVSFAIFGLFYAAFGHAVPLLLARVHFWLAQVSLAALVVGLYLLYSGKTQYEPIAAISSLGYAASFLVFALAALSSLRGPNR